MDVVRMYEFFFCRELLLNNNLLRVLPYELGRLFRLQTLGLKGKFTSYFQPNLQLTFPPNLLNTVNSKYLFAFLFVFNDLVVLQETLCPQTFSICTRSQMEPESF